MYEYLSSLGRLTVPMQGTSCTRESKEREEPRGDQPPQRDDCFAEHDTPSLYREEDTSTVGNNNPRTVTWKTPHPMILDCFSDWVPRILQTISPTVMESKKISTAHEHPHIVLFCVLCFHRMYKTLLAEGSRAKLRRFQLRFPPDLERRCLLIPPLFGE